jgi:hypothetical protein
MEYTIKLDAKLPKGDPNGFDDGVIAEEHARARLEGRDRMYVAVILYDVHPAAVGADGVTTAKARVRRVQPVQTDDGRRAVEGVLRDEYTARHGGAMLPFEVASVTKAAFADLPRTPSEVDEEEERERENMSPHDELRRHLERVHGRADAHLLTDAEAAHRHEADHDGDMPEMLQHDREWTGWTRADLEAAEAESEESGGAGDTLFDDSNEAGQPAVPMAEFRP